MSHLPICTVMSVSLSRRSVSVKSPIAKNSEPGNFRESRKLSYIYITDGLRTIHNRSVTLNSGNSGSFRKFRHWHIPPKRLSTLKDNNSLVTWPNKVKLGANYSQLIGLQSYVLSFWHFRSPAIKVFFPTWVDRSTHVPKWRTQKVGSTDNRIFFLFLIFQIRV